RVERVGPIVVVFVAPLIPMALVRSPLAGERSPSRAPISAAAAPKAAITPTKAGYRLVCLIGSSRDGAVARAGGASGNRPAPVGPRGALGESRPCPRVRPRGRRSVGSAVGPHGAAGRRWACRGSPRTPLGRVEARPAPSRAPPRAISRRRGWFRW